jgi:flagellar motor switch protein FliG
VNSMDKERLLAVLPSWQKIAVLLVALGDELAADLMRQLDDDEAVELTKALVELKRVPQDVQDRVLAEFEEGLLRDGQVSGGAAYAHQVLERALGPDRAREMVERAVGRTPQGFDLLRDVDPARVAPFIAQEHPQTIALILSQLSSAQAAGLLAHFPGELQAEVAHRMATLGNVDAEVLRGVEESLADLLQGALGKEHSVGGSAALAAILNAGSGTLEKGVLERMDQQDPEVAEDVRRRLFSFEDLARLRPVDMEMVLGQIDMADLRLALRAADKSVRDAFFSAMSERRRLRFVEDLAAMPPARISEVRAAQDRIVHWVRSLEQQRLLRVPRPGEDDTYV